MSIPANYRFAESHEWVREEEDGTFTIGISDHAQGLLGDMVFVELPAVGDTVSAGEDFAVAESVKAASDVYAPLSGEVLAVNEALEDSPELVNSDAYGEGWFVRIGSSDAAELDNLMDATAYGASIEED